jgi:hypothetical protein
MWTPHRLALLLLAVQVAACAGENAPGTTPIRTGDEPDGGVVDADLTETTDAASPPVDAATPPVSAPWAVDLLVRADRWDEGLRARLVPPQAPLEGTEALLDTWPTAVPVFEFDGPAGRNTGLLEARLAAGRPAIPWLVTARRPDAVATDLAWLKAFVLDEPDATRRDGRPVLYLDAGAVPETVAALAQLGASDDVYVIVAVDSGQAPALPAGAAAVYLRDAAGVAPLGQRDETVEAAQRRWLEALPGAVAPSARAPRNPRLASPQAPVEPPVTDALLRSIVRARRLAAGPRHALVLDALGGWSDDRQLDPVRFAEPTSAPSPLTDGVVYEAYGGARFSTARALLGTVSGPPPVSLGTPEAGTLLTLRPTDSEASFERLPDGYRVALFDARPDTPGRTEWSLDTRPFVVPPGARLTYARTSPFVALALRLEDGTIFSGPGASADAPATGPVEASLEPVAGRRIDEVVIVYAGGTGRLDADVIAPRVETR